MIVLGHPDIPFEPLHYVESVEEIARTPAGATLWLGPYKETVALARHCRENGIGYGVMVFSLTEAVLANALGARYILAEESLAPKIQKAADTHLFDARILVPIDEENEIEKIAELGIDGVIFQEAITFGESS